MKKKSNERRIIILKDPKKVSPIKQIHQTQQVPNSQSIQKKPKIPRILPKNKLQSKQLDNIAQNSDLLIGVQLMKKIIEKQTSQLDQFYQQCPPIFKSAFQKILKNVDDSLNNIKQQRLQRLKDQNVVFIPPDKDYFQHTKGKVLNNCIKQQIKVHENKKNIDKIAQEQYNGLFNSIHHKIVQKSQYIPKQLIQDKFQKIAAQNKQHNQKQIQNKSQQLKQTFMQLLQTTNLMRINKIDVQNIGNNHHKLSLVKSDCKMMKESIPSQGDSIIRHKAALFMPEDYLL